MRKIENPERTVKNAKILLRDDETYRGSGSKTLENHMKRSPEIKRNRN
jgi:hypothetical protein